MAAFGEIVDDVDVPVPGWDSGVRLGKRYTSSRDQGLEVLVTHEGKGTLGDGVEALVIKESKPLPSSG